MHIFGFTHLEWFTYTNMYIYIYTHTQYYTFQDDIYDIIPTDEVPVPSYPDHLTGTDRWENLFGALGVIFQSLPF